MLDFVTSTINIVAVIIIFAAIYHPYVTIALCFTVALVAIFGEPAMLYTSRRSTIRAAQRIRLANAGAKIFPMPDAIIRERIAADRAEAELIAQRKRRAMDITVASAGFALLSVAVLVYALYVLPCATCVASLN
jgi:hypothetical protein